MAPAGETPDNPCADDNPFEVPDGAEVITLELPTVTLCAFSWGPADGPLALCLHGFPDTAHSWRHLGPQLAAEGYHVVAPFMRGYAPSTVPSDGDYHVGALMSDAVGIHRLLEADNRAVVIGHDWGALTSNGLAAYGDSPFAAVVSMAVPPVGAFTSLSDDPAQLMKLLGRQLFMSWYMMFVQLPKVSERSLDRLIPLLWRRWSPGYDADQDLRQVFAAIPDARHRSAVLGYYRAMLRPTRGPGRAHRMQAAAFADPLTPLLYLHGADDGCMQSGFTGRAAKGLPTGSSAHVVADAGHFLHLEQPAVVGELIVNHLREISGQ